MANTTTSPSLWREGFQAFQKSWRLWARWAFIFVGSGILIDTMAHVTIADSLNILNDLGQREEQPSMEEVMPLLEQVNFLGISLYFLAQITLSSIAYYIFVIFYTAQELPLERYGVSSFKGFMSVYWKVFEACLLAALPFLGGLLLGSLATALTSTPTPLLLALGAGLGASIYISLRTTLVMPLSAIDIENPIRTSWQRTEGQTLRLLGNAIVFHLLAMGAVLLGVNLPASGLSLVLTLLAKSLPIGGFVDIFATFISITASNIASFLFYGLMAAYAVRSTRILGVGSA